MEMADLLPDRLGSSHYIDEEQSKSTRFKHQEALSIVEWLQCFSTYTAVISRTEPSRTVDLLGYQNLIIQSYLKHRNGDWATYDHQFRLKASATTVSEWSVIDTTLWNLAFSTQVSPLPKDDRGEYRSQCYTPASYSTPSVTSPLVRNQPICFEWNDSPLPGCPHPKMPL